MIDHDHITGLRYGSPMFKGPITDFLGSIRNLQFLKECAQYELQYVDCMEAYGYHRGKKQCRLILEDMYECSMRIKRIRRVEAMHQERRRQYKNDGASSFCDNCESTLHLTIALRVHGSPSWVSTYGS